MILGFKKISFCFILYFKKLNKYKQPSSIAHYTGWGRSVGGDGLVSLYYANYTDCSQKIKRISMLNELILFLIRRSGSFKIRRQPSFFYFLSFAWVGVLHPFALPFLLEQQKNDFVLFTSTLFAFVMSILHPPPHKKKVVKLTNLSYHNPSRALCSCVKYTKPSKSKIWSAIKMK